MKKALIGILAWGVVNSFRVDSTGGRTSEDRLEPAASAVLNVHDFSRSSPPLVPRLQTCKRD